MKDDNHLNGEEIESTALQNDKENLPQSSSEIVVQYDQAEGFTRQPLVRRRLFVNITNWETKITTFGTIQMSPDGRTLIDAAISNNIMLAADQLSSSELHALKLASI
eukprot:gene13765-4691_t